jgi:hypothetical protein
LAFSYWIDNLGFITEGRLVAVLIIPSLGVTNWSIIYIINTAPSVVCGTSFSISPSTPLSPGTIATAK